MFKLTPIKKYVKELKTNYFTCDIKYNKKELKCLNDLKIIKSASFNYYGSIDKLDDIELNKFIKSKRN